MAANGWSHLGIRDGQVEIDLRDEAVTRRHADDLAAQEFYLREDGLVRAADDDTVLNKRQYDAMDFEAEHQLRAKLEADSDYKYLVAVAGNTNIDPINLMEGSSTAHNRRVTDQLRDALVEARKSRLVTLEQRQKIYADLLKQQSDYQALTTLLDKIYNAFLPTVRRWYWLASVTGAARLAANASVAPSGAPPNRPYWLLTTRYRREYTHEVRPRVATDDAVLLTAPDYDWAKAVLTQFETYVANQSVLDLDQRNAADTIYVALRDDLFAFGFTYRPLARSLRSTAPVRGRTLHELLMDLRSVGSDSVKFASILANAVTTAEAERLLAPTDDQFQNNIGANGEIAPRDFVTNEPDEDDAATAFAKRGVSGSLRAVRKEFYAEVSRLVRDLVDLSWRASTVSPSGAVSWENLVEETIARANGWANYVDNLSKDAPAGVNWLAVTADDLGKLLRGQLGVIKTVEFDDVTSTVRAAVQIAPLPVREVTFEVNPKLAPLVRAYFESAAVLARRTDDVVVAQTARATRWKGLLVSVFLWTRIFQSPPHADRIVARFQLWLKDAVQNDLTRLPQYTLIFVRHARYTNLLGAFANDTQLPAHVYKEVLRSTFAGTYLTADEARSAAAARPPHNRAIFRVDWTRAYDAFFAAPVTDPARQKYFPDALSATSQALGAAREPASVAWWRKLVQLAPFGATDPAATDGVPPLAQLAYRLTDTGLGAVEERALATALEDALRTFEPALLSDRLADSGLGFDVPWLSLLQSMVLFTTYYYPKAKKDLRDNVETLEETLRDAQVILRNIITDNDQTAATAARELARDTYVPDRAYHLRPEATLVVSFSPQLRAAVDTAVDQLRALAAASAPAPAPSYLSSVGYGGFKRQRVGPPAVDYSHLAAVPKDVLTANTNADEDPTTHQARRDYLEETDATRAVIADLRSASARLVAQCMFQVALDFPDQYKTVVQHARAPARLAEATKALARFRFSALGGRKWAVARI